MVRGYDYVVAVCQKVFGSDYNLASYNSFSDFIPLQKPGDIPHIARDFPRVWGFYTRATSCLAVIAWVRAFMRECVCTFLWSSRSDSHGRVALLPSFRAGIYTSLDAVSHRPFVDAYTFSGLSNAN